MRGKTAERGMIMIQDKLYHRDDEGCGCGCGHDHDHDHEEDQFEVQLVTLVDEDGNEQEFEVIEIFKVDEKEYVAIAPPLGEEDDDEVMVFRLEVDAETGEELLRDIEDDEEWNRVSEVYMAILDEDDED